MTAPIKIVTGSAYLGYVRPVGGGASAETHLAHFQFPNVTRSVSTRAVVKIYPSTSVGMINEIIGYCLAKAAHVPQPEHAAVFPLTLAALPQRPSWIPAGVAEWPAFCTNWIPKNSIKPWFDEIKGLIENPPDKKTRKALRNISSDLNLWARAPLTSAFDEWTGNSDRNMGNLIRMKKGDYRAIDHGMLFGSAKWTLKPPGLAQQWDNKLRNLLALKKSADTLMKAEYAASSTISADYMAEMIDVVLKLLDGDIEPGSADFVRSFLGHRADPDYLRGRYRMLV